MAEITLVTGGCRSGKSSYAEKLALASNGPLLYLATCPNIDDEMNERIRRHRQRREQDQWQTIEEELNLAATIRQHPGKTILVDCLTLWINN